MPLAYALTTRTRVMDFMGQSSLTTTEETVLDRIIDSVTNFVENYCQRRFKQTVYTEEFNGDGSEEAVLNQFPISSTASFALYYRNADGNEDEWTAFDTEDYFINYNAGIVELAANTRFLKFSRRLYRAIYTAGYNFDNAATFLSDTSAADLEYAVWRLCTTAFNKRKSDVGIESESIGDYSVTYSKTLFETPEIKEILDKYKRVEVAGVSSPKNI